MSRTVLGRNKRHGQRPVGPPRKSLLRADLETMLKAELIDLAEDMGLSTSGTKSDIVDRLLEVD